MEHALGTLCSLWLRPHRTRAEILRFQRERLRELVQHAYDNVAYYRRLFDAHNLRPEHIRSLDDLHAIPITSRRDIQGLPVSDITASGINPHTLIARTSGGSSGQPMTFRRTSLETRVLQAFRLRAMHHFGLRMADRLASIVARRPNSEDRGLLLNVIRGAGLYRHDLVNCLQPTDQIWRQLKRISPTVLGGFPSAVARLVQDGRDVSCADVRPRFVAVGGDTLTPLMRQQIADAFGVRVFEMYNSVECGTLAWQCRDTSALHTCDDALIIEVLRNGVPVGDDERGEVVVTNLHTFAMPLIRLRLGDIVVKGSSACDCGAPFGTIRSIEGRMMDYFPLPSGRIIHPYSIVPQLGRAGVPWMRAYRLLQERRDRFVLTLVAGTAPSDAELAMIRRTIVEGIGEPVQVDVQLVDHLELERNGKFRVARSLVTSMYDEVPTLPPVEAAEAPMLIDAGPR